MTYTPGNEVPTTGIYWCSVCKLPAHFKEAQEFPACTNLCGRCHWELVEADPKHPSGH
jgi:hypothetical protein